MTNILIAEDDRRIAGMIEFKLARAGHGVLRAEDGARALELVRTEPVDLILLDVMLPVLTGLEVLTRLKEAPGLQAIPVVILSSRGRARDVQAGREAGAVDYIVKPFSLKDLLARVEQALADRVGAQGLNV